MGVLTEEQFKSGKCFTGASYVPAASPPHKIRGIYELGHLKPNRNIGAPVKVSDQLVHAIQDNQIIKIRVCLHYLNSLTNLIK